MVCLPFAPQVLSLEQTDATSLECNGNSFQEMLFDISIGGSGLRVLEVIIVPDHSLMCG